MPWLAFKNGLLLKLADILQTLAVWLTPEVHAPGLQEDSQPQVEDDFRAQWMERYKASHPPEDWLQQMVESSGGDSSAPIGGKVVRDRPPLAARRAAIEAPARAVTGRRTESALPSGSHEQPRSSQEPGSKPAELKLEGPELEGPKPGANSVLPHQRRIGPGPEARTLGEQSSEAGMKAATMHSTEQIAEHQEPPVSTAFTDAAPPNQRESAEAPKQSWLLQVARSIANRLRPAVPSSVLQARGAVTKPASTRHPESPDIFSEGNAPATQERESQAQSTAVREQAHRKLPSGKSGQAAPGQPPRLSQNGRPLTEQDEIVANHNGSHAPRTALQTSRHRQREIATTVVPWPNPTVRVTAENDRWTIPVSLGSRGRNLTAAASSSWKQTPDQEAAPGLPLLPSEFRPLAENSGDSASLYPWPELPQVVEEDPDEPRKLLQYHERQLRILREQRGAW